MDSNLIHTGIFIKPRAASKFLSIFHDDMIKDSHKFNISKSQVHPNGLCEILAIKQDPALSLTSIMNELKRCQSLVQQHCSNTPGNEMDLNGTIELSDDDSICVLSPARGISRRVSFKRNISNDSAIIIESPQGSSLKNCPFNTPKRMCVGNVSDLAPQVGADVPSHTSKKHSLQIRCHYESPFSESTRKVSFKENCSTSNTKSASLSFHPQEPIFHAFNPHVNKESSTVPESNEADKSLEICDVSEDCSPSAPLWSSSESASKPLENKNEGGNSNKSSTAWSEVTGKASGWLKSALAKNINSQEKIVEPLMTSGSYATDSTFNPIKLSEGASSSFLSVKDSERSSQTRVPVAGEKQEQEATVSESFTKEKLSSLESEPFEKTDRIEKEQQDRCFAGSNDETVNDESSGSYNSYTELQTKVHSTVDDFTNDIHIDSDSHKTPEEEDDEEEEEEEEEDDIIIEKELKNSNKAHTFMIDDSDDDIAVCEVISKTDKEEKKTTGKKKKNKLNKSIKVIAGSVFTASTSKDPAPDFIPLNPVYRKIDPKSQNHNKKTGDKFTKFQRFQEKKQKKMRALQKKSPKKPPQNMPAKEMNLARQRDDAPKEQKRQHQYDNNVMNPDAGGDPKTGLRPIVIDASNVSIGHGRGSFSVKGLQICIKYFTDRGHKVHACAPKFRRFHVPPEDRKVLDELEKQGILSYTPSRTMPDGRKVASYDDRFIVQVAHQLGGIIVSTDNFRDLIEENEAWRETIEQRLLMFTWVGDMLLFPNDPLGRHGPHLQDFLRFPDPVSTE